MKTPLRSIIAEFISSADLSEHQFMRLWNMGVRLCREFQMDVQGTFKTALLSVNADKTVTIPTDFLSFSKMGILNESGDIVTLTQNNNMSSLHSQYLATQGKVVDVPEIQTNFGLSNSAYYPLFWFNYAAYGGGYGYHLYGLPSGTVTIGEYNIDEGAGLIYLNAQWPYQTLLLEYLSDGFDCDGEDYMIDPRAGEAFIAGLRWKNAQDNRKKFSMADVEYLRREFYRQKSVAKRRINQVDINQMQKAFRFHTKLAAKA